MKFNIQWEFKFLLIIMSTAKTICYNISLSSQLYYNLKWAVSNILNWSNNTKTLKYKDIYGSMSSHYSIKRQ